MDKPIIVTIANNKGGVAKTTTTVNASAALARIGYKVLVIDADPQSNATATLLSDKGLREQFNLMTALIETEGTFSAQACPTKIDGLDIVPNNISLMEWEQSAYSSYNATQAFQKVVRKDFGLSKYDLVIIDTPPNIGPMLRNALMISHHVVIPVPVGDQYALDGFSIFWRVVGEAREFNANLSILGILLTRYDGRAPTNRKVKDKIELHLRSKQWPLFNTVIRTNTDLEKAARDRMTIFQYDAGKIGAHDYTALAKEIGEKVGLTSAEVSVQ